MAHPDMDTLLDEGLRAAIYFLQKNGEFFPFGVTMSPSCRITHVQGWTGDEHPLSKEVIDVLLRGFTAGAERGEYKATALICDVRVSLDAETTTDAISVGIEHLDDEPVTCLLPYSKNGESFEFGELVAERGDRRVFKG